MKDVDSFGLSFGYFAGGEDTSELLFQKLKELLYFEEQNEKSEQRRNSLLNEKIDLNQWMINLFKDVLCQG